MGRGRPFIEYPHLTLALHQDELEVIITLPHRAKSSCRRNLLDLGPDGFEMLVRKLAQNLLRATRAVPGAKPMINALQRHYPSQRAAGIVDARLMADLRTALPRGRGKVKAQPLWVRAVYDILNKPKGANLQIGIGAFVPYGGDVVRSRRILDVIASIWIACAPWLDVVLGRSKD